SPPPPRRGGGPPPPPLAGAPEYRFDSRRGCSIVLARSLSERRCCLSGWRAVDRLGGGGYAGVQR
ncbi:MAG: hypothetical protein AMXMBFR53_07000, partial [Gemmatimonadota bacterium]